MRLRFVVLATAAALLQIHVQARDEQQVHDTENVVRRSLIGNVSYWHDGGFTTSYKSEAEGLAPGFCSANSGDVCSWQNSWWVAEYTRRRMLGIEREFDWQKFIIDFRKAGVFTKEENFFSRICASFGHGVDMCVTAGPGIATNDLNNPNAGQSWDEIFRSERKGRFVFDTLPWSRPARKNLGLLVAEDDGSSAGGVGGVVSSEASILAAKGGGWIVIPYEECRFLSVNESSAKCTLVTKEKDLGKLALDAYAYVLPVRESELSDAWKWFGNHQHRNDLYVVSGFVSSLKNPDVTCDSTKSNLCSVQNVQNLVAKAFQAFMNCRSWLEAEALMSRITYSDEYKVGDPAKPYYLFMASYGDIFTAHGANSALVGKDMKKILTLDNVGLLGKDLSHAFRTAAEESKDGWVSYFWPAGGGCPDGDLDSCPKERKVSYVVGLELFGNKFYLGSGYNHIRENERDNGISPVVSISNSASPTSLPPHADLGDVDQLCSAQYSLPCATKNTEIVVAHAQSKFLIDGMAALVEEVHNSSVYKNVSSPFRLPRGPYSAVSSPFYVFIFSFDGPAVAHGANPALVGKSLADIAIANNLPIDGEKVHQEFRARAESGGGYVKYTWAGKDGVLFDKLSYIVGGRDKTNGQDLYIGCGYNMAEEPVPPAQCESLVSSMYWSDCSQARALSSVGALQTALYAAGTYSDALSQSSEYWQILRNVTIAVFDKTKLGLFQHLEEGKTLVPTESGPNQGAFFTHVFTLNELEKQGSKSRLLASGDPLFANWTEVGIRALDAGVQGETFEELVQTRMKIPTSLASGRDLETNILAMMNKGGGWISGSWTDDITVDNVAVFDYKFYVSEKICMQVQPGYCVFIVSIVKDQPNNPKYHVKVQRTLPPVFAQVSDTVPCDTSSSAIYSGPVSLPCLAQGKRDIVREVMQEVNSEFSQNKPGELEYDYDFLADRNAVCDSVRATENSIGFVFVPKTQDRDHMDDKKEEPCDHPHLLKQTIYQESLILMSRVYEERGGGIVAEPTKVVSTLFSEDIVTIFCFLFLIMVMVGVIMWYVERKENSLEFHPNLPDGLGDALWWCIVTATTVGYGDKVPHTESGKIIAAIWMFIGMSFWSFFTAVLNADISRTVQITQLSDLREGSFPAALEEFSNSAQLQVATNLGTVLKTTCKTMQECADRLRSKDGSVDAVLVPVHKAVEFNKQKGLGSDLWYTGDLLSTGQVIDLVLIARKNDTLVFPSILQTMEKSFIQSGELFDEFLGRSQLASDATSVEEPLPKWSGPSMMFTYIAMGMFCVYVSANFFVFFIEKMAWRGHFWARRFLRFIGRIGVTHHSKSKLQMIQSINLSPREGDFEADGLEGSRDGGEDELVEEFLDSPTKQGSAPDNLALNLSAVGAGKPSPKPSPKPPVHMTGVV